MNDVALETTNDARRQRVVDARARLVRVLGDIAGAASEQALVRCPYRTRHDRCTFRGVCSNQIVRTQTPRHCAGGMLNPAPAAPHELP